MIVTADWVLPVSRPPVRTGAVLVRGHEITAVGPLERLRAEHPGEQVTTYPGCTIVPGLVNAHTHLSLTALEGLVPSMSFSEWLPRIATITRAMNADDFAASAAAGSMACLKTGVTVVGDIAYGPEAISTAGDAGLAGTFFWEVLGIPEGELPHALARMEFPGGGSACAAGRLCYGISPHAPYTSGPGLLRATHSLARRHQLGYMVHVAESPAEQQLLIRGEGPLGETAARLARGFEPPRCGSVEYLHRLGVLSGAIAVHCVHLETGEADLLAKHARGVVLCPRSNRYLHNGAPPVSQLHSHGVDIAVGTDSAASNEGFDLFAEARALAALDPELTPKRLLGIMSLEGARVLGVHERLGSLDPGKQADLAVIASGGADDPTTQIVATGSPDRVRAVMSAGVWRVLDGELVAPVRPIEKAAEEVRARAARVLARSARPASGPPGG